MKSIRKLEADTLCDIALEEYYEYYDQAVRYKDFDFIIQKINDEYNYNTDQYLNLKMKWHFDMMSK